MTGQVQVLISKDFSSASLLRCISSSQVYYLILLVAYRATRQQSEAVFRRKTSGVVCLCRQWHTGI